MENSLFTEQQETYLTRMRIPIRLSCLSSEGWPIVLSLWYRYQDGQLWCATQKSSLVVQYLRQQPRCGFEIAADDPPYCGVRGRGEAELKPELGQEVLEHLLIQYTGGLDHQLAQKLLSKSDNEVAIVITPHHISSWNFADRMADIGNDAESKLCPD